MQKRPVSVSIISSWLIFSGLLALVFNLIRRDDADVMEFMNQNPIPMQLQFVWAYGSSLVSLVSGLGLLKGRNWSRFLYVSWTGFTLLISLITSPIKAASIPGLILLAVISFFLFQPKAEPFYRQSR